MKGWACDVKASVRQDNTWQKWDFASKPVANAITVFGNSQSMRKMSRIEFISALLTDNVHGGKVFHCSGCR